jgi:hypothetical protein
MAVSVLCLVVLVCAIYVRIDGAVNDATVLMSPHAAGMVRNVARIVNNTASATESLAVMGTHSTGVVAKSAPLLAAMVNSTHAMIDRVNQFTSRSPSITIGPTAGISLG